VPFHLKELRLIDLALDADALRRLGDVFTEPNLLETLQLVNIRANAYFMGYLSQHVASSSTIQYLDLSWCEVTYKEFAGLFREIRNNKVITHLILQQN
jgi:hypothetical protein